MVDRIKEGVQKVAHQLEGVFSSPPKDVVAAIKEDHDTLRKFLSILKDTDGEMGERRRAYAAFSSLLKSHSKSEEKAVYQPAMKLSGHEMHIKVAEGYVEHKLADDLMKRMEATDETLAWSAHANVLSETVEHHLKEEERDLLTIVRKTASKELNQEMLHEFISLRKGSQKKVSKKNAGVLDSATVKN